MNLSKAKSEMARPRLLIILAVLMAAGMISAIALWSRGDPECGDLSAVANLKEGDVADVRCVPAFVVRMGGNSVVLLARSPHLGERLIWDQKRRLFLGQHGESFAADGTVVTGPGNQPLWRCPTVGSRDNLRIKAKSSPSTNDLVMACKNGPQNWR